ncbi:MAG: hypothetical protein KDK36_06330, partial [Leptospiraceae bacterium]|nr:hypothetical protein [Leptospiraceae bacterium]
MKELFYDYNLQLLSIDSNSINPYSPSFYYGYSIYETIFIKESKPVFYNEHVDRLKKSAGYFK